MTRAIRNTPDSDTGIYCHFINICYWAETQSDDILGKNKNVLLTRAFVELLKHPSFLLDPDRPEIMQQIMEHFCQYIADLEGRLDSNSGAVASLDAITVFTIGVLLSRSVAAGNLVNPALDSSLRLSQVYNILAILAARQSAVRGLRDIVSALQRPTKSPDFQQHLRALVANSEIVISHQIRTLLFDYSLPFMEGR